MSDPTAVAILAKLTSWYTWDNVATDAHGSNDITLAASPGYEPGLFAEQIKPGARGAHTFGSPPAFARTSGQYTIGGWFDFTVGAVSVPEFGLFYSSGTAGAEAFTIVVNPAGFFYVQTWEDEGVNDSPVSDPLSGAINYPVTVQVEDSIGQTAQSAQVIRIVSGGAMVPGRYFVAATWDLGHRILYVDSVAVASSGPPGAVKDATLGSIGIGRPIVSPTNCITGQDECFVCMNAALTGEEIAWLYNSGDGRSYAEVVAAAA